MKKLTLLAVVALIGLVGLSTRAASITNADLVNVKLTLLIQTNVNDFEQGLAIKLTNKDVLQAIANEFTNSFPGKVVPKGATLAITSTNTTGISGNFEVFTNKVLLLANASTNAAAGDNYQLALTTKPGVTTKSTQTQLDETDPSSLTYNQAGSARTFTITGLTTLKGKAKSASATTFSESFKFIGSGSGTVNASAAIVAGTVSGSGKGLIF
jgi:hypothetical protein